MNADFDQPSDGARVAKIVGIVLASFFVLLLVCCGGFFFLSDRVISEVGSIAGAPVPGSGGPAVQERLVRDFRGIETDGLVDVDVTFGDDWSVKLRADDNILPLITTEVRGATLVFSTRGSYSAKTDIHATVVMPAIDHVTVSGLGDVSLRGVSGATLTIDIDGSGGVVADGAVESLVVTLSAMGDARLFDLVTKTADVEVTGMGDAEVHVTESLAARVKGMGDVTYRGSPPNVEKEIDGMGDVEAAD